MIENPIFYTRKLVVRMDIGIYSASSTETSASSPIPVNSRREAVWAEIKRWTQETTIHGIPKIYKTQNKFLNVFWSVGYMACLAYLLYAVMQGLLNYLLFSVITMVAQKRSPSIPFPTVTLCNKYPFKSWANPKVTEILHSYYGNMEFIANMTASNVSLYDMDHKLEYQTRLALLELDFNRTERLKFFYGIDEMLIQCVYNNRDCNNLETDFERHTHSYRYGYCYKFNSGRNINANRKSANFLFSLFDQS